MPPSYDSWPLEGTIMPHYPSKPGKEVLADMINEANTTTYTALQFTAGAPVAVVGTDGRNTQLPVTFPSGRLADGALTSVYYKRLDFANLFGAQVINFDNDGSFVNTVDLLPTLFNLYGVKIMPEDVINEVLDLSVYPAVVTISAAPNSLSFYGQFDATITLSGINWRVPIDGDAVQLFNTGVSPFNGDWFADSTWTSEGTYSLRSANIGDLSTSSAWIDIVDGSGRKIGFDYKVDTELNYDLLRLFVNGAEVWNTSGAVVGNFSYALPAGAVNVEWRYTRDASNGSGLNSCWIDRVRIYTPVSMVSGIVASHPSGAVWTSNLNDYAPIDDVDGPQLNNTSWATMAAFGPNEIYALDGLGTGLNIHASYDGCVNWVKRFTSSITLSSNESVFFQGKMYFLGQDRTTSEYGVYRLDVSGAAETLTLTPTRVLQISGSNASIDANADRIAVFDGALRYSSDATTWNTQNISHPYPTGGVGATMTRMQVRFVGSDIVGLGRVSSVDPSAPQLAMFVGALGGTYTWKPVEPYGAGIKGDPTKILMTVVDGNLLVALSEPQDGLGGYLSAGDIIRSVNLGDSWSIVASNTGIYPISFADDGTYLMLTGYRQRAGQYHWQAVSQDRGAGWQYDTNENSFFGTNQTDYTFAVGVKPMVTTTYLAMSLWDSSSPYDTTLMAWADGVVMSIDQAPGVGRGGAWSKNGGYYAQPQDAIPFVSIYKNTGGALTKLADPVFNTNGDLGWSATFNPTSTHLALGMRGNNTSYPYVAIFARSGDTFSQVAGLLDAVAGAGYRVTSLSYNKDGTLLATAGNLSQALSLYAVSGDSYTKVGAPGTIPLGKSIFCAFSPTADLLAYVHDGNKADGPLTVYSVSGQTMSIVFQNTVDNKGQSCSWSKNGAYLAAILAEDVTYVPILRVYAVNGTTLTEAFSTTISGGGWLMPVFTDTHLLVAREYTAGAVPSYFEAYTLGTFARDATADITVLDSTVDMTQWGASSAVVTG